MTHTHTWVVALVEGMFLDIKRIWKWLDLKKKKAFCK